MQYVLIVDDDPDARAVLCATLRNVGVQVELASTGLEAIATIEQRVPILILLDLRMPEMNGFELLFWLRSNPDTAGVPVVVISAYLGNMQLPPLQGLTFVPKGQMRAQSMRRTVETLLDEGFLPNRIAPVDKPDLGDIDVMRDAILSTLTQRELEVLKLIALRLSNDEIANRLSISLPTVKTHVSVIFDKLNVPNRREAARQAFVLKLV